MTSPSELRTMIVSQINKILVDSGRTATEPSDDQSLVADLGLDSLDLAVLVVSLEQILHIDPFREGTERARTVGELTAVYQKFLPPHGS